MKRYTVLTYITDNYEEVHEIVAKDPEAEYILVTDNAGTRSDTWTVVHDRDLEGMSPFGKAFYIRYNCFKYSTTGICLRIDGSIEVRQSLKPLIDMFEEGGYDAALMIHPKHTDFISEYRVWEQRRNYPKKQAERCLQDMAGKGYDFNYRGLFQTCFSIQRRNEVTEKIDSAVFAYLKQLGRNGDIERLDQIPFSYIMNTQFSHLRIMPVSEQILRSYCMQWYYHRSGRRNIPDKDSLDNIERGFMFNKEVRLVTLYPADCQGFALREQELTKYAYTEIRRLNEKNDRHMKQLRLMIYVAATLAAALIATALLHA